VKLRARSVLCVLTLVALVAPVHAQILGGGAPLPPPPVPPNLTKLDPLLQAALSSEPTGRSLVIVRGVDAESVAAVRQLVLVLGGLPGVDLPVIEAVAADVPNASLALLTQSPLIRRLALDRLVLGSLDTTAATVGAATVRQTLGYDGTGIGVAVIDSGITPWHDDLTDPGGASQRVDQFVDFVHRRPEPYDGYGHGTHVAGVIAGNGHDSSGARAGIAPGARLTILKVLDTAGKGRISNVIAALGYVVDHRTRLNIRVVNLSVGTGVYESYHSDFLTVAAQRVVDAGVVVVASAGNGGRTRDGVRQYGAITAPGNAPWVLTVGASSHMGTASRADDVIADFSSRGPTAVDRAAKPDVVAPGVGVVSLSDPDSVLYHSRQDARVPGTVDPGYSPYLSLTGTSQAAPVVAGSIALMLHANPSLTPNAVKAILQYTAESHGGIDPLTQGAGFVNVSGAVEIARLFAAGMTSEFPAPEWSGRLVWGNQRVGPGRLLPDANAWGVDVRWGSGATAAGEAIAWGIVQDAGGEASAWRLDSTPAENAVWGDVCGGANCTDRDWSVHDQTVVWGTEDGDTVVWGTEDGDTVVWGTDANPTVVWGSSEPGDQDAGSEPVEMPAWEGSA
jgi:serine protease AprX